MVTNYKPYCIDWQKLCNLQVCYPKPNLELPKPYIHPLKLNFEPPELSEPPNNPKTQSYVITDCDFDEMREVYRIS